MSIQQAAAQALAAVQRAQTLFGPAAAPPAEGGATLGAAAAPLAGAGQRASVLSGDVIDSHHSFVNGATKILTANNDADTALDRALANAATVTQRGRTQLDDIVSRTRALAQTAATTRSATGQRILLQALQTEVSKADAVVEATKQQGSAISGQIRGLGYQSGAAVRPAGFGVGGAPQDPPLLPLPEPPPHPSGPPPAPPPGRPQLQGLPAPLQDFTTYTINGIPVPPPPPPNVTADELRLRIMQQGIDADKFMEWYNAHIPKDCSFGDMLARMGGFVSSSTGAIASIPALPEGAPLTVAAVAGALGSAYSLSQCVHDPYTPLPPYPGP
jgi:hypothetical protein